MRDESGARERLARAAGLLRRGSLFVTPLLPLVGLWWAGGRFGERDYSVWHLGCGYLTWFVGLVGLGYVSGRWNNPKIGGLYHDWFVLVVSVAGLVLNLRVKGPLAIDPVLVVLAVACFSSIRLRRDLARLAERLERP